MHLEERFVGRQFDPGGRGRHGSVLQGPQLAYGGRNYRPRGFGARIWFRQGRVADPRFFYAGPGSWPHNLGARTGFLQERVAGRPYSSKSASSLRISCSANKRPTLAIVLAHAPFETYRSRSVAFIEL